MYTTFLFTFSFIVGYGTNFPAGPHHQAASCPKEPEPCNFDNLKSPKPNPIILTGALVGGPVDDSDFYEDNREGFFTKKLPRKPQAEKNQSKYLIRKGLCTRTVI
jgi:hypothetical protein